MILCCQVYLTWRFTDWDLGALAAMFDFIDLDLSSQHLTVLLTALEPNTNFFM